MTVKQYCNFLLNSVNRLVFVLDAKLQFCTYIIQIKANLQSGCDIKPVSSSRRKQKILTVCMQLSVSWVQVAEPQCYLNLVYRIQSPYLEKDKCEWENTALCISDNTNSKIMA